MPANLVSANAWLRGHSDSVSRVVPKGARGRDARIVPATVIDSRPLAHIKLSNFEVVLLDILSWIDLDLCRGLLLLLLWLYAPDLAPTPINPILLMSILGRVPWLSNNKVHIGGILVIGLIEVF